MDISILQDIGLTKGEIAVYLALCRKGETTSGPLIEESGVSASKVYQILDRLSKKGLSSHIMKKETKYFKAADPARLLDYFHERQDNLRKQEAAIKNLIPFLENSKNSVRTSETAQVYDGLKGIQTARERTLKIMKRGDEMWVVGIATTPYDGMMGKYFREYHTRRFGKGIRCKYIYNEAARKPFGESSSKYPLSEVKYLPKDMITHAWLEIYADTVTIGLNKGLSFSVVIQNHEVANSFREYAKLLWKEAAK